MKRMFWLAGFLGIVFFFSGCNTIRGMGEDIQWTGEQIQNIVE